MHPIETSELTKYYGDVRGIEDLSLSVESGEIFGFLGPNGAGKTTTIRTLMGFMAPTAGSATVLGVDVTNPEALRGARANVGYLPGDPAFDNDVTGERFLAYHADLKDDSRRKELLELFDPPLEREIGEYSRGNRQMLGLVQTFMHDPDLVLMDEPTSGLDPLRQARLNEFLREERDRGTTIFFSSHVLSEVRKVCDRVGIVREGRVVELAPIEDLLERSGRLVTLTVAEESTAADFDVPGVHDLRVDDAIRFVYTGEYNRLLAVLSEFDVLDLEIAEAPLEDVFMRFYDDTKAGNDPVTNGDATGGDEEAGTDA